jgi:hypothetical protein
MKPVACFIMNVSAPQVLTAAHCLYNTETNRLTTRTSKKGKDGSLVFHTFVFVGGLVSAEAGEDAERVCYRASPTSIAKTCPWRLR